LFNIINKKKSKKLISFFKIIVYDLFSIIFFNISNIKLKYKLICSPLLINNIISFLSINSFKYKKLFSSKKYNAIFKMYDTFTKLRFFSIRFIKSSNFINLFKFNSI